MSATHERRHVPVMGRALPRALAAALAAAALLAGCSSSTQGTPAASPSARSHGSSAQSPTSSAATFAVPDSSASQAASSSPTATASAVSGCVAQSQYCDTFADPKSGWAVSNHQGYYSNYDPYLGGSYRIGLRGDGTEYEIAPVHVSSFAPDDSIQIDADVTIGQSAPTITAAGFECWLHSVAGQTNPDAFSLLVNGSQAEIGIYSGGRYHAIVTKTVTGLQPGVEQHLAVQCLQVHTSTGVVARLAMRLNGTPLVSTDYAHSVKTYSWSPADRVAVVTQGHNADMFFDNFAIAHVLV